MKNYLIAVLVGIICLPVSALDFGFIKKSRNYSIWKISPPVNPKENKTEGYSILTADGYLFYLAPDNKEGLAIIQKALQEGRQVNINNEYYYPFKIETARSTTVSAQQPQNEFDFKDERMALKPSVVTPEELKKIMSSLPRGSKGAAACVQRASAWSWHLWKNREVITQKAIVFFTQRFLCEEDDNPAGMSWPFHIAPTVLVKQADGSVKEMVIDPRYLKEPVTPEEWANYFVKGRGCREAKDIFTFWRNASEDSEQYCYLLKALPMGIDDPTALLNWNTAPELPSAISFNRN